jgi:hypothetical protein
LQIKNNTRNEVKLRAPVIDLIGKPEKRNVEIIEISQTQSSKTSAPLMEIRKIVLLWLHLAAWYVKIIGISK